MRYEDWDVLAFPASQMPCAPLPEYTTKCVAIHDNALRAAVSDQVGITPLLTCFLPALRPDEPFQISVHNWQNQPAFAYQRTTGDGASTQVWQVRIDIDGRCSAIERYPLDVSWPQIVSCANQNLGMLPIQGSVPLRFPPFYPSSTQINEWDPADETGRIMVEISEGYVHAIDGQEHFTKLKNYALFNFQPAPLDLLQRVGIAWPNAGMFEHPLPARPVPVQQYSIGQFPEPKSHAALHARNNSHTGGLAHQRNFSGMSANSSHYSSPIFSAAVSGSGTLGPPPPTPAMSMSYGISPGSLCDESSRSTSAYSNVAFSSLPMVSEQLGQIAGQRAPLKAILNNMNVSNANRTLFTNIHAASFDMSSMPPPPLPQYAVDAKVNGTTDRRAFTCPELRATHEEHDDMPSSGSRRVESQSNESDVSMHAACTSYPACTSEDAEGHIVHNPAAVVQGRKEGTSSSSSDQNYISGALSSPFDEPNYTAGPLPSSKEPSCLPSSSPADGSGRKRTRAATRALLNAGSNGSPEKAEMSTETAPPAHKLRKRTTAGSDD